MIEALQHRFSISEKRHILPLNRKVMIVHAVRMILAGLIICVCAYFPVQVGQFQLSKVIQLIGFVALGSWHTAQVQKPFSIFTTRDDASKWFFTLAFTAGLIAIFLVLQLLYSHFNLLTGIASAAAFVLPFLVFESWVLYVGFTQQDYPPWHLPLGLFDKRATIFLNSVTVKIKVAGSFFYPEETLFITTGPSRMQLGKLFHRLVVKQNSGEKPMIELLDETRQAFAWTFYAEGYKGLEQRVLDPEATLIQNKLKDGSTIVATRVKAPRALPPASPR
ncbi:MAG: TssN family type VI secretion system protein [Chitinophagaceae bacterium]